MCVCVCVHACMRACLRVCVCVITTLPSPHRRFVTSPNFEAWYTLRKEEANQKLRLLHLDTLCKAVSLVLSSHTLRGMPQQTNTTFFFYLRNKSKLYCNDQSGSFIVAYSCKICCMDFCHLCLLLLTGHDVLDEGQSRGRGGGLPHTSQRLHGECVCVCHCQSSVLQWNIKMSFNYIE